VDFYVQLCAVPIDLFIACYIGKRSCVSGVLFGVSSILYSITLTLFVSFVDAMSQALG